MTGYTISVRSLRNNEKTKHPCTKKDTATVERLKKTTSCLKTKEDKILMDKEKVSDRWTELCDGGDRSPVTPSEHHCHGPQLLTAEVEDAFI